MRGYGRQRSVEPVWRMHAHQMIVHDLLGAQPRLINDTSGTRRLHPQATIALDVWM